VTMPKPNNKAGFSVTVLGLAVLVVAVVIGTAAGTLTGSTNGIFVLAAALIALLFLVIEAIAQFAGASLLRTVIIGEDGRTSTSKTFVLMWTLLVGWALVALLIAGELLQIEHCVNHGGDCSKDAIGFLQLGWHSFLHLGLDTSYLVLLGIPAAAAVAGKVVTESKVASGTMPPPVTVADKAFPARVMQIFSADDGSTDIADFQYVIFNLILATYFVSEVVHLTSVGLPPIPETLLGLTSVSAALYVAKKAATRTQPTITAVFPSFLLAGKPITITGNNLTDDPALPNRTPPKVMINGVEALNVAPDNQIPDRITATVPPGLNPSPTNSPIDGKVEVLSSLGFKTPVYPVTLGP
jgi:IPT/TIG domain